MIPADEAGTALVELLVELEAAHTSLKASKITTIK